MTKASITAAQADERSRHHLRLISSFFAVEGLGKTESTLRRYQQVHAQLLAFLDDVDPRPWLGPGPAALLEAERHAGGRGAFFRIFDMDELVCCLPGFLADEWLLPGRTNARTQVSLVDRLMRRLLAAGRIDLRDLGCAWFEAESVVLRVRRELHAASQPGGRAKPARLRLIRGGLADTSRVVRASSELTP